MSNIYVPLRAFGDFTITTSVIKNHFSGKMPIILPGYLKNLYDVLNASDYYDIVDVIDMDKSPRFFELHKIKKAGDWVQLVNEILAINKHLKRENNYLFDYRNRRLNPFMKKFSYPQETGNIYQSKIQLLEKFLDKKNAEKISYPDTANLKKVIIFPGSRKRTKSVDFKLVQKLMGSGLFNSIDFAYHQSEEPPQGAMIFYDFNELKNLILNYDLVISADSLPLHLSYYFNKPHFGIYNHFLNEQWLTPYIQEQRSYTVYLEGGIDRSFGDIKNKFTK